MKIGNYYPKEWTPKELNKKISELQLIESTLQSSKQEIDETTQVILPAFETYSQALSQLLADLYWKKQEIEGEIIKIEAIYEALSIQETCFEEEKKIIKEEYEEKFYAVQELEKNLKNRESELNKIVKEKITELSNELEEKLKKIQEKEQELNIIKEEVLKEKEENKNIAMMLKLTHLELENEKNIQHEKIRNKKDKLRILKQKLEEHLKAIQLKEN